MKTIYKILPAILILLFGIIACNNTSEPQKYKGQFGDKYVFLEIHGNFITEGDSQYVFYKMYSFDEDSGALQLNAPVLTQTENFELVYGLALSFQGSMTGELNVAGKVSEFPKTVKLSDLVSASLPLDISLTLESISETGGVNYTLSVSDPNSTLKADTTTTLEAGESYQTGLFPPFTITYQDSTVNVTESSYQAHNYGFQQKQDISFGF